jgi:hypothetical protein
VEVTTAKDETITEMGVRITMKNGSIAPQPRTLVTKERGFVGRQSSLNLNAALNRADKETFVRK